MVCLLSWDVSYLQYVEPLANFTWVLANDGAAFEAKVASESTIARDDPRRTLLATTTFDLIQVCWYAHSSIAPHLLGHVKGRDDGVSMCPSDR